MVRKLGSPREGRRGESERVQISVNPRQHCISIHILGKGGKTPERDMVGGGGMKSLTTSKQVSGRKSYTGMFMAGYDALAAAYMHQSGPGPPNS